MSGTDDDYRKYAIVDAIENPKFTHSHTPFRASSEFLSYRWSRILGENF